MNSSDSPCVRIVIVATAVLVALAGVGGAAVPGAVASQGGVDAAATLVVDADGGADHAAIQDALNASEDGDTVEVRPGTYEEGLVLSKNVTLVAPDGATLNGSASSFGSLYAAIEIPNGSHAAPTVDGFHVVGYRRGIVARGTHGDFTVRDTTFAASAAFRKQLNLRDSTGDWTLVGLTVVDHAVDVDGSTGDWTVRNTTVEDATTGIDANRASGDFTISDVRVHNTSESGIRVFRANGTWTVEDTVVSDTDLWGIAGGDTTGAWTIRDTVVRNASDQLYPAVDVDGDAGAWRIENLTVTGEEPTTAVEAVGTTGPWTVANSSLSGRVDAAESAGNWTLRDSTVTDGTVVAADSTGAWTLSNVTLTGSDSGVLAGRTTGDWLVVRSTFSGTTGLVAEDTAATSDWRVENTTIAETDGFGISAGESAGDWAVRSTEVVNASLVGVYAENTTGDWSIRRSTIVGNDLNANDAAVEGDATLNWWGQPTGPGPGDCYGNVDCSNHLTSDPLVGDVADGAPGTGGDLFIEPIPGAGDAPPTDTNGDGLFEDVNGDGSAEFADAIALAFADTSGLNAAQTTALDFDGDGDVDFDDAIELAFLA